MKEEILEQQTEELEEYYYETLDDDLKSLDNKTFQNRTKAIQMLMEQKNQTAKIELESKKLDFEIEQSKKQFELEQKKIEIEQQKADNEEKASKKEFRLGIVKVAVSVASAIASVFVTIWSLLSTMKFEETGSLRSSVGKNAQKLVDNTCRKLDKTGT